MGETLIGASNKPGKWTMPVWMRPYCNVIGAAMGAFFKDDLGKSIEYIEEFYNDKSNVMINAPRAMQSCSVHAAITLLIRLHELDLLKEHYKAIQPEDK